jgi:hypothetical protein
MVAICHMCSTIYDTDSEARACAANDKREAEQQAREDEAEGRLRPLARAPATGRGSLRSGVARRPVRVLT